MLIALTSILLLTYFGPMVDPKLDAVGWISQTATLLTLLGGAALTGSQGPDCDCDAFIGILGVFLPVVNVLPLFVIVYLIASTVFDLCATQTLNPSAVAPTLLYPYPSPCPSLSPRQSPSPHPHPNLSPSPHLTRARTPSPPPPNPAQVRLAEGAQAAAQVRSALGRGPCQQHR